MERNTLLVIGVCAIVLIALGIWMLEEDTTHSLSGTNTTLPNNSSPNAAAQTGPKSPPSEPKRTSGTDPAQREATLWATPGTPFDVDIPGAQSQVEGAMQIQLNSNRLRSLRMGDALVINVPQTNQAYRVIIDKIDSHSGGIKVISAQQQNSTGTTRLLLTLGQKNTFANLATGAGNYELVGNADVGWLMPSRNMDQHLDPMVPDYVIPQPNEVLN